MNIKNIDASYKFIIYKTTNNINKKIYIGLHMTKDINDNYYGSGRNFKLAIKKYGKENFSKEILQECSSLEELKEYEIFWINYYKSTDNSIGYNLSKGGEHTPAGCKNEKSKKYYIYDLCFYKKEMVCYGVRELAFFLFGNNERYGMARRVIKRNKGFYKYKYVSLKENLSEYDLKNKIEERKKEKKNTASISHGGKKFIAISPSGEVYKNIYNITKFAYDNNLDRKSIEKCLTKKYNSTRRWRFIYNEEELRLLPDINKRQKTFIGTNPEGEKVLFHSKKEVSKYDLNPSLVSGCLCGSQRTHKGWEFKYV